MRKANINDTVYVFTNWGLVKAIVVKERVDKETGVLKYKVDVNDRYNSIFKEHGFWYTREQLNRFYFTGVIFELFKPINWFVKNIFKG